MDNPTLGILICQNYYKELNFVITEGNFKNIITAAFASNCAVSNLKNQEKIETALNNLRKKTAAVEVIGGEVCSTCANNTSINEKKEVNLPVNCIDYFMSESLINQFISENYYIITPGWLNSWKQLVINVWGFDEHTAKLFFAETAKKILLLDTGVYPDYQKKLKDFSDFIGLPFVVFDIGIDYFQMKVEKLINNWIIGWEEDKKKQTLKEKNQKLANYAMLFDIIPKIAVFTSEKQIIQSVINLLQMLFSPEKVLYVSIDKGEIIDVVSSVDDIEYDKNIIREQFKFPEAYQITENRKGLKVKVSYNEQDIAYIRIDNFLFPEYLNSYFQELNTITTFLGLFMINSRQHNEISTAKDKLEQSEIKLKESNQAKDKFFSIIAHDLKGPFSTILAFSELLHNKYDIFDEEKRTHIIQIMYQTLQDTYKLLENLLYWARSQKGSIDFNPKLLNLHQFANDVLKLFNQTAINKSILLKNEIPRHISVEADNDMLSTIIRNLVSNAIKFTPKSGEVLINSELVKSDKGSIVKVIVKDSGIGIGEDAKSKLFDVGENFSTPGTDKETGTGLGLILCKEFVERHEGEIWVESVVGKGTEFIFTLPVKQEVD